MSAESKRLLRKEVLEWLRRLSPEERRERSERLCTRLTYQPEFYDGLVMVFASLPTEPDLGDLWQLGVPLVFPRVVGQELELRCVVEPGDLIQGSFGIREPHPDRCQEVPLQAIDLIVVPGLAFEKQSGVRLGRGGGFYDRLLAKYGGSTCGACFQEQLLEDIPWEAHDCRVQRIVTDRMTVTVGAD